MSSSFGHLFSPSLISQQVVSALPQGYTMRPLLKADYDAGFLDVLRVLTEVGEISSQEFDERFDEMTTVPGYYVLVVLNGEKRVVGTGALVFEKKFIHKLGTIGHIEDIAVAKDQQGKKLGLHIIKALTALGKELGCYKSIMDCDEANEGFYVKCGYKHKGVQMAYYYGDDESS